MFQPFFGNASGFNLIGMVTAAAIAAIGILGGGAALKFFSDNNRHINQKAVAFDLKYQLLQTMKNPSVCACHLNPDLRADVTDPNSFRFNSTLTPGGTLHVQRVRAGCAGTDPILAEVDLNLDYGLTVEDVQFTDLVPTGHPHEWRGKWRISFKSRNGETPIAPVEAHQFVLVNPASVTADPTRATIQSCGGDLPVSGLITSCPAGFMMVGNPNQYSTYCIQSSVQAENSFLGAKYACGQMRPDGFGPGHLCTRTEWAGGCNVPDAPANYGFTWEWFADNDESHASVIQKAPDCSTTSALVRFTSLAD